MSVTLNGSAQAVLQVQTQTNGTLFSTTALTPQPTSIAASINPQNTSSKILVIVSVSSLWNTSGSITGQGVLLYKNGSLLYSPTYTNVYGLLNLYGTQAWGSVHFCYLDSPASTSTQTYQIYFGAFVSGTAYINYDDMSTTITSPQSTITVMEISGV
jgi:hypothetical protein